MGTNEELERIKALTGDKNHIRQQALRLAGTYLQSQRNEIVELEASKIEEEDREIETACIDQLEVIGDEIVRLGEELETEAKEFPHPLGNAYLLNTTSTSIHRVVVDDDQAFLSQALSFSFVADDIEMLKTVLKGVKADKKVPHSFSNINARYNYFYEPAGASNAFIIRHVSSGRTVGMDLRTALKLLSALTGKTKHLTRIGRAGSPLVTPRRRQVWVNIKEINTPSAPNTFDTTVAYASDALPEWFKHLQSIVEDETFTDMTINLGGKVRYHISLIEEEVDGIKPVEFDEVE